MIWQSLNMLNWLWVLPVFVLMFVYAGMMRRRGMAAFADAGMQERLLKNVSFVRRRWKQVMILAALCLTVLALARPAWNPVAREVSRKGRDVVFVLDVSRSMLADDLQPNRLERAKIAIGDCLDVLEGDRVALVVFAGTAMVRCPLTVDYGFFRMMLADVEPRSVGRGGTKIGDALRLVMKEVFDNQEKQFKDVVLITDGEDQDSFAVQAAEALGKASVRLLAVGLGDEVNGTPILVTGEDGSRDFIKNKGEVVRSKLDGATLREMVAATPGGRYLPVATGNFDLGAIYRSLIATAEKRLVESETVERYEEKYQIFLLGALLLLLIEPFIGIRKSSHVCLLMMAFCLVSLAGEADKLLKQGNSALNESKYDEALSLYDKALVESPENPYLIFNKGVVYFKQGEYEKAVKEYKLAIEKLASQKRGDSALEARAFTSIGNACFLQAKPLLEGNLEQASALCLGAIAGFDEALRMRPEDATIQENRKAARMLLKKILGIKYMQAKEQQKQQEMAQKLKELAERQKQAADETAQAASKQEQPDVQKQEQLNQETQELMEQMNGQQPQQQPQQPQQPQQQNPVQEAMQQARQAQDEATQQLKDKQLPEAEAKQREAAEKLEEALKQGQQQQQQQQQNQDNNDQQDKQEQKQDKGEDDKQEQDKDKQEQDKDKQEQDKDKQEQDKDKQDESGEEQKQQEQNELEAKENQEQPKEDALEAQEIIDRERQNKKEREQGDKRKYRPVPMDW